MVQKLLFINVLLLFTLQNSFAQLERKPNVVGYITVVKTSKQKYKGILSQVNDSLIQLICKKEVVHIPVTSIQKIRIIRKAKNMKSQNLALIPWFQTDHGNSNNSILKETGENIAANLAANAIFAGTQLATGSLIKLVRNSNLAAIEKFHIRQKFSNFQEVKLHIDRYSLYYQTHAQPKDQLQEIKQITERYRTQHKENI